MVPPDTDSTSSHGDPAGGAHDSPSDAEGSVGWHPEPLRRRTGQAGGSPEGPIRNSANPDTSARPLSPSESIWLEFVRDDERRAAAGKPSLPIPEASPSERESGNRYNVLRMLGEGGFGTVYLAEDRALKQKVAIKVLHLGTTDERTRSRFIFEAQTAANLRHPGIVNVFDIVQTEDGLQQVMEYYAGGTLRDRLEDEGAMPPKRAVEIILKVLDALAFAHRKGIIHRDIKPANIFFGEDGSVKIGDFGLCASFEHHDRTMTGESMGTPLYMAPEQMKDAKSVDQRADIYSVGLLLYHMLTGERPVVIDLSLVPASLRPVLARVTAQNRDRRLDTCEAFKAMIEEVMPLIRSESENAASASLDTPLDLLESGLLSVGALPREESNDRTRETSAIVQAGRSISVVAGSVIFGAFVTLGIVGGYITLTSGGNNRVAPGSATPVSPREPSSSGGLPAASDTSNAPLSAGTGNPVDSTIVLDSSQAFSAAESQRRPPAQGEMGGQPTRLGADDAQPSVAPSRPLFEEGQSGDLNRRPPPMQGGIDGRQALGGPNRSQPGTAGRGGQVSGLPFHMPTPAIAPLGRSIGFLVEWIDADGGEANSLNLNEASTMIQGGNRADPRNPIYPYLLGRIAEKRGQMSEARAYYDRAELISAEFMERSGEYMRELAELTGVQIDSPQAESFFFGRPARSLR